MPPVTTEKVGQLRSSADQTSEFQIYHKLGKDEIRLVEITPASSEDEDVVCRLRQVLRLNAPPYQALSYCWGPQHERGKGHIFLDVEIIGARGKEAERIELPVALTLQKALQRLRCYDGRTSQLLWIDAICIDQTNEKEKGEQVQSMHLIYQEAAEVAVWLGDEDKESLLAWELIEDFERCQGDVNATRDLINISRERQFAGLLSLFRRDYFWRIWVVQEITCAQKARVHCGSKTISWSNLHRIGNDMERLRETLRDTIYRNKPAALFSLMTGGPKSLKVASDETFVEEKAPPLFDLLQLHMSKLSTDPHDKVYGLMGIASDGSSFGPIDYARSPRATFVHTACCIIRNTKKLNAICLRQDDDNIYNLPSWVPDWERRNLHPSHRVVGLHIRRPPFAAAKDTHADAKFKEDKEVLLTSGFVVDIITTAAKPLYLDGPESETTPTLIAFHNWFTVYTNNVREKDLDVFARTFCGGAWYPQYSEFEKDLSQRLVFFFGLIQK